MMKLIVKIIRLTVVGLISIMPLSSNNGFAEEIVSHFKFDLQGDVHYSRYNFTDIKNPYDGLDGWTELKFTYLTGKDKSFGVYASLGPSLTSEDEFWWQKNCQLSIGLQWYPIDIFYSKSEQKNGEPTVEDPFKLLRSFRLYALYAMRGYYDKPDGQNPEDTDIQIGVDYYFDNLNNKTDKSFVSIIWTNAGYRKTNFSFDNYDAFLWSGNIKTGFALQIFNSSIVLPYVVVADWTYSPTYNDRWWENFVRIGGGFKIYPFFRKYPDNDDDLFKNIYKRFNFYIEVLNNATWIGDEPISSIEETDYRVGISFSTFFNI